MAREYQKTEQIGQGGGNKVWIQIHGNAAAEKPYFRYEIPGETEKKVVTATKLTTYLEAVEVLPPTSKQIESNWGVAWNLSLILTKVEAGEDKPRTFCLQLKNSSKAYTLIHAMMAYGMQNPNKIADIPFTFEVYRRKGAENGADISCVFSLEKNFGDKTPSILKWLPDEMRYDGVPARQPVMVGGRQKKKENGELEWDYTDQDLYWKEQAMAIAAIYKPGSAFASSGAEPDMNEDDSDVMPTKPATTQSSAATTKNSSELLNKILSNLGDKVGEAALPTLNNAFGAIGKYQLTRLDFTKLLSYLTLYHRTKAKGGAKETTEPNIGESAYDLTADDKVILSDLAHKHGATEPNIGESPDDLPF